MWTSLAIYLTYKKLPLPLSKPSAHGKHFMACLLFRQRPWNEVENRGVDRKALERIRRLSYLYAFSMLNQQPTNSSFLWAFYAFVDSLYTFFLCQRNLFIVYFRPLPINTHGCFLTVSRQHHSAKSLEVQILWVRRRKIKQKNTPVKQKFWPATATQICEVETH